MSITINSFDECLSTSVSGKRHLLLGNGFSRACRNDIFSYDSLFDSADFNKLSENIPNVFKSLSTTDFEKVMQALESTHRVLAIYDNHGSKELIERLQKDSVQLKNVLVETIASHHPETPNNLSNDEFRSCIHFLKNFEKIYSTNYDLLLYWVTMKASEFGEPERDDGFRDPYFGDPENYEESDYVDWQNSDYKQDIHYLHGALHLYYNEGTLKKYCWSRTGVRLLNQINEALENKMYPLIVAEGTSSQKLDKIQHSNYLGHNYRSLRKVSGNLLV